jgi:hypothetical protein
MGDLGEEWRESENGKSGIERERLFFLRNEYSVLSTQNAMLSKVMVRKVAA